MKTFSLMRCWKGFIKNLSEADRIDLLFVTALITGFIIGWLVGKTP